MLEYDIENSVNSIKENNGDTISNGGETIATSKPIKEPPRHIFVINKSEKNNNTIYHQHHHHHYPTVARKRWKLLARAITQNGNNNPSSVEMNASAADRRNTESDEAIVSVRRFHSFNLIEQHHLMSEDKENFLGSDNDWFTYKLTVGKMNYMVNIHHISRPITASELMGFNNTGNVCIWPSEEALAFYSLENINSFQNKMILELGGGMTCLAGLLIAKYGHPHSVHLTDGNSTSVENVRRTCRLNDFSDCYVKCSILKWENISNDILLECGKFDFILSADCLFFDESRSALVDTMWQFLSNTGCSLVMAPRRGNTLDAFVECAVRKGFSYKIVQHYNDQIWRRHTELINSQFYDENIHYPILIQLTKSI